MSIYAQHGFGRTDKIEEGVRNNILEGVILSPRDEKPAQMSAFVAQLRAEFEGRVAIMFDPQFYATTLQQPNDRYLPEYKDYYESSLTRSQFISADAIRTYVRKALNFELQMELDFLISPAVSFESFTDPWSQIALTMAQESVTWHEGRQGGPPMLVSLVFSESALTDVGALTDFLDILSIIPAEGFYILVQLNDPNYPPQIDETKLARLMYFVYVLGHINSYAVVCGYTDLVGILLQAVGAKTIATGWSHSLRRSPLNRFHPQKGGRQPRPRYTSRPLLNSILVSPELEAIHAVDRIRDVLSDTGYDELFRGRNPGQAPWTPQDSCLHHWAVLSNIVAEVCACPQIHSRLELVEVLVNRALANYTVLEHSGVPFERASGTGNLESWLRAIRIFRSEAGI